jgi:methylenetetrahydrofolate dehydrogenase (NADP+)/methenyltetrahydrofolate cyclohydrolase
MIIDGKKIANEVLLDVKKNLDLLKAETNITPVLAVVVVGDDVASRIYVNNKKKACEDVGMILKEYVFPSCVAQDELVKLISKLNADGKIHGILVQLPLPEHINKNSITGRIDRDKDVDCFNSANVGDMVLGLPGILPCTAAAVEVLLDYEKIDVSGKHCVVVGRSNIVGKPTAIVLLQKDATVTVCHSKTRNLKKVCLCADVLVCAVGHAGFITADMVKPGAVVIDVGINRFEGGKICGDVVFDQVSKVASYVTPVPGGVGPLTVAMLIKNLFICYNVLLYKQKLKDG